MNIKCFPVVTLIFFVLMPIVSSCSQGFMDNDVKRNIKKSELLIKALECYYQKNAKYPPSLNELIPTYIDTIPMVVEDDEFPIEFVYERGSYNQVEEYQLMFFSQKNTFFSTRARDVYVYRPSGYFENEYSRGLNTQINTNEIMGNWAHQTWSKK